MRSATAAFGACAALLAVGMAAAAVAPVVDEAGLACTAADGCHGQRFAGDTFRRCCEDLDAALEKAPKDYGLLWRRARAEAFRGDRAPEKEKLAIYERARIFAERAVAANPDGWEGHYRLGAAMGKWGRAKGILKSLALAKPMRDEMNTAVRLNLQAAGPHYALSMLYRLVPGVISIGDKKKSLVHAQRAVELDPSDSSYQLELGESLRANGRKADAKAAFERVKTMPPLSGEEVLAEADRKSADEALQSL